MEKFGSNHSALDITQERKASIKKHKRELKNILIPRVEWQKWINKITTNWHVNSIFACKSKERVSLCVRVSVCLLLDDLAGVGLLLAPIIQVQTKWNHWSVIGILAGRWLTRTGTCSAAAGVTIGGRRQAHANDELYVEHLPESFPIRCLIERWYLK